MNASFTTTILCVALAATAEAQSPSSYPVKRGRVYQFERIADGVYYASGYGVGSNNVVIINETDVVIVDTGNTPAAARAFVNDIKLLTPLPVRFVINTHWHFDHTDGNSIFGSQVQIIATEHVRHAIETFDVLHREPYLRWGASVADLRVAELTRQLASFRPPERKRRVLERLRQARQQVADYAEVTPTPPTLTYSQQLILHRGHREIDLLFLGRGHTAGDTVVYLPAEGIVCSGDLMQTTIPNMGDAFFDEWLETLDALKGIDFRVDLPGHGEPFSDKRRITALKSYLADVIVQGSQLRAEGVSADEAARRVDLRSHAPDFPEIREVGADLQGMRRLYAWLGERELSPR